jgi:hypothetical protein
MPSWPRSWANFSLSSLYSHRSAWANFIFWANLTSFSLQYDDAELHAGGQAVARVFIYYRARPAPSLPHSHIF